MYESCASFEKRKKQGNNRIRYRERKRKRYIRKDHGQETREMIVIVMDGTRGYAQLVPL